MKLRGLSANSYVSVSDLYSIPAHDQSANSAAGK